MRSEARRGTLVVVLSALPVALAAAPDVPPGLPADIGSETAPGTVPSLAPESVPNVAGGVVPGAASDLFVALGADGRSYVAQHAISSEGALVRLSLPLDAAIDAVRFAGPERETFASAHRRVPTRVSLWSGSALVRYRGTHGDETLETSEAGDVLTLRTTSVPDGLAVEDGELALSSIAWAFPDTLDLVSFTSAADGLGTWRVADGLLSFERAGVGPATLRVVWRRRTAALASDGGSGRGTGGDPGRVPAHRAERDGERAIDAADACTRSYPPDDACLPDTDADGVPDHRDVCPAAGGGRTGRGAALAARIRAGTLAGDPSRATPVASVDAFGCPARADGERAVTVLDDVVFPAGGSYLDLAARDSLDRLADALEHALGSDPTIGWEIAAYTDGAGSRARNGQLSAARAQAVRRYLMLRGIGPNRLRARGHGETRPLADDRTERGRRTNRRIEIERVD